MVIAFADGAIHAETIRGDKKKEPTVSRAKNDIKSLSTRQVSSLTANISQLIKSINDDMLACIPAQLLTDEQKTKMLPSLSPGCIHIRIMD